MTSWWSDFCRDDRGNMAILFAFGFTVSIVVAAVAVDSAALYQERRQVQAGVDLAAISAASDPSRAAEIAQSVLVEARLLSSTSTDGLTVTTGRYDPTIPDIADRFVPGGLPVNAAHVHLERVGTLNFASSFAPEMVISASGLASVTPEVSFSVGSRLASLNGGIANAVLSDLLGTTVSLSALDYSALAATEIDALDFLDLMRQKVSVTAVTYDELLDMDASAGLVAETLAGLTTGPVQTALLAIAGSGAGNDLPLSKLFSLGGLGGLDLGTGGVAGLSLSALEILTAAAAVADGDHQVTLNLGAGVPGLVSLRLDLFLGEPPQGYGWFAIGPAGTVVRTAQLRLRITTQLLGGPILLGAGVRLPLWLDLAHSEAVAMSATCPSTSAPHGSAAIAVRPGVLRLGVGELSDTALTDFGVPPPQTPVTLLNALLLRVTGSALVEMAQTSPVILGFSSADIAAGTLKTASTTTPISSLTGSLLGDLDLTVNVLGLGLSSPALIAQALRDLLSPLTPVLDQTLESVLGTLGLGIGEADVRVYGVRCDRAVLVG